MRTPAIILAALQFCYLFGAASASLPPVLFTYDFNYMNDVFDADTDFGSLPANTFNMSGLLLGNPLLLASLLYLPLGSNNVSSVYAIIKLHDDCQLSGNTTMSIAFQDSGPNNFLDDTFFYYNSSAKVLHTVSEANGTVPGPAAFDLASDTGIFQLWSTPGVVSNTQCSVYGALSFHNVEATTTTTEETTTEETTTDETTTDETTTDESTTDGETTTDETTTDESTTDGETTTDETTTDETTTDESTTDGETTTEEETTTVDLEDLYSSLNSDELDALITSIIGAGEPLPTGNAAGSNAAHVAAGVVAAIAAMFA